MKRDDELARHYEDPANRPIAGRPSRRLASRTQTLSTHVPIRFSASTMAAVQALAHGDGITVSAWIRSIVERELVRRLPPQTISTVLARAEVNDFVSTREPVTTGVEGKLLPVG